MTLVKDPYGGGFIEVDIVDEDKSDFGRFATSSHKREYNRRWAKNNPEKVKAYNDFWNQTPKVKAMKRAYDQTQKRRAYKHEWYLANKARSKAAK